MLELSGQLKSQMLINNANISAAIKCETIPFENIKIYSRCKLNETDKL